MTLHWEQTAAVAIATIDRPEARNALNANLCNALSDHLAAANADAVRAVVVTGVGSVFSSGADLAQRRLDTGGDGGGIEHGGGDSFRPAFERLGFAIAACPVPVIAAMNGHALGAGLQLAVQCDLRVLATDAKVGIPATKLGVMVSASNTARLVRLVGPGSASEMLLSGRQFSAAEALAMRLVHRVDDDPLAASQLWATELSALAPLSVRGHKRSLQLVAGASVVSDEARAELSELEDRCFASADLREGLLAFKEKRPPEFRGV